MTPIETDRNAAPVRIALVTTDTTLTERVGGALEPIGPVEILGTARHALGRLHDGDFDVAVVDMDTAQAFALVSCIGGLAHPCPVVALTDDLDQAAHLDVDVLHRTLSVSAVVRVAVARAARTTETIRQPVLV